jgi:hypothetical protein
MERDSYMMETATATPEPPQRLRALERANEVRLARAELKRRIAGRQISAAEVILCCPWEANSWAVAELLLSQRRWGRSRCQKFLGRNQVSEVKTIGALTERQRWLLAEQLECTDAIAGIEARMHAARNQDTVPAVEMETVTEVELETLTDLELETVPDVEMTERYALVGAA